MIVVETDRIYCVYCRTNKHVQWRYADYGGRYATEEQAVQTVKNHYPDTFVEYRIENMIDCTLTTGTLNNTKRGIL